MAIKGKGRTKSRGVARPPRRAPVAVPEPLARRRWVQVTAAFLLGLGVYLFAIWFTNGLRTGAEQDRVEAERTQQQQVLQSWQAELEAQLGKVGTLQDLQISIGGPVRTAVTDLKDGDSTAISTDDLRSSAESIDGVATAIEEYDLVEQIRGKGFGQEADAVLSSRLEFVQGLRTMRSAALLAVTAKETKDEDLRAELVERADELVASADALLNDAYRRYRLVLADAGIALGPTTPQQPTTPLLP